MKNCNLNGLCYLCVLLLLNGCGGSSSDDISNDTADRPDPPNIAGIWSGTWEGIDASFGPASGTWEARISQSGTDVRGPMLFGGDIDCAEGRITGTADAESEQVSGEVHRDPCPFNEWIFTAFNQDEVIASGSWEKQGLSSGTFEGKRIAKFTGPNIRYVYPPGASARGYITIVGERLTMDPVNETITLGPGGPVLVPETVSDTAITLKLPDNINQSEHLVMQTSSGQALSPKYFNTNVTRPVTGGTRDILFAAPDMVANGIAFSVNGRRAFVANAGDGSVSMINVERAQVWTSTVVIPGPGPVVPVYSVAIDPAGRNVYVAGNNVLGVLHAHTLQLLRTVTVPASGGVNSNPQGIAVSPDGRWLLLSEAIDGGRVTILDVENQFAVADTLSMAAGNFPRGIATSPDNTRAFIAVSGNENAIWVYDFASATVSSKIIIGASPAAVAITPDAGRLYITNAPADTVNYYDLESGNWGEIDLGFGVAPLGLAITPDGLTVYVTGNLTDIYLIDVLSNQVTPVAMGDSSKGLSISPDGKLAYVTLVNNKVVEIGGQRILRISKQGGGIGVVKSASGEIYCGNTCNASFDAGSRVRLTVIPDSGSNSTFSHWSGDADCRDGQVTMTSNLFCVANFTVYKPPVYVPPPDDDYVCNNNCDFGAPTCFIATAAYGTWLDPHVLTLRQFRDDHLLTNAAGTWLVDFYYRNSPPIADYIREREALRTIVRWILGVIIFAIEYPLVAGLMLILILLTRMKTVARPAAG